MGPRLYGHSPSTTIQQLYPILTFGASGVSEIQGVASAAHLEQRTMNPSKSTGLVLAFSTVRGYFFVEFTGRYACGRPETLLTH